MFKTQSKSCCMSAEHLPVMASEVLAGWFTNASGYYIDGTFGRGGHSRLLLPKLESQGQLLVVDRDPDAIDEAKALQLEHDNVFVAHADFASLSDTVEQLGWQGKVTGILLDLGVSSPQLDQADRGFSFMRDGPLDMRMNPQSGMSAADWLATAEIKAIARVLRGYGEEKYAMRIARAIVNECEESPILTTQHLVDVVESAVPAKDQGKHKATRTFQAIRIYINQELEQVEKFLEGSLAMLAPGGRLAIISFHSLEDRIVKRFMRNEARGDNLPSRLPIRDKDLNRRLRIVTKAQRATEEEIKGNPRARSAMLRVAEKL